MVQTIAQMVNAARHAVEIHAEVLEERLLAIADFEQFSAMMEGQLVVMLAAAIDDHTVGLRKRAHGVLDARGKRKRAKRILLKRLTPAVMARAEEKNFPSAAGGVGDQLLKLLFFLGIARSFGWRVKSVLPVYFWIGLERWKFEAGPRVCEIETRHFFKEDQRADNQPADTPFFPGIERAAVIRKPLLDWVNHVHPRDERLGGFGGGRGRAQCSAEKTAPADCKTFAHRIPPVTRTVSSPPVPCAWA